nr:hypothetical protein [Lacticaseibacillus thailandensis]
MVVVISDVVAAEVVSAVGTPALQVTVVLNDGTTGVATVATPGRHDGGPGVGLLDGGDRLHGLGVLKAVNHVNTTLHDELRGQSPFNQRQRDATIADATVPTTGTVSGSTPPLRPHWRLLGPPRTLRVCHCTVTSGGS